MFGPATAYLCGLSAANGVHPCHSCGNSCNSSCTVRAQRPSQGTSFKLTVHVHAATVPSVGKPGPFHCHLPRLEFILGDGVQKSTDDGEYTGEMIPDRACDVLNASRPEIRKKASRFRFLSGLRTTSDVQGDFPWRFGDSITFTVHVADIVSAGLKCNMNMHSQLLIGPLQIQLQNEIIGGFVLDIRRTVLPACAYRPAVTNDGTTIWQTPVDLVPLTRMDSDQHSGLRLVVVGQVALSFSVNVDPNILMQEASEAARPLAERMLGHCAHGCERGRFPTECGNELAPSPRI